MPSAAQVEELAEQMWTLLDDMGRSGKSVSGLAKAYARVAFEPFITEDRPACSDWMSLERAKQIIECCDKGLQVPPEA